MMLQRKIQQAEPKSSFCLRYIFNVYPFNLTIIYISVLLVLISSAITTDQKYISFVFTILLYKWIDVNMMNTEKTNESITSRIHKHVKLTTHVNKTHYTCLIPTQQNSYSISHLLGTVTTQWLPLWRCSHCSLVPDTVTTDYSLVPDTVTTEQWLHRTHTLLGIHYHGAYVEICLLGT